MRTQGPILHLALALSAPAAALETLGNTFAALSRSGLGGRDAPPTSNLGRTAYSGCGSLYGHIPALTSDEETTEDLANGFVFACQPD